MFLGMILAACTPQDPPANAEDAIRLHGSSVKAIHSIDAIIRSRAYGASNDFAVPIQKRVSHWSMQGSRQRLREQLTSSVRPDQLQKQNNDTFYDILIEKGLLRTLEGWDPDKRPDLTPVHNHGVSGTIEPYGGHLPLTILDPLLATNFAFTLIGGDPSRSLEQIRQVTPKELTAEEKSVDGKRMIRLTIPYFNAHGEQTKSFILIDLDPDHNYLARRVETIANEEAIDGGQPVSFRNVTTVVSFGSFHDGLFFPTRLENESYRGLSAKPTHRIEFDVEVKAINGPLPADAFDFHFPKYTLVRTLPPINGKVKVELWGSDNRPLQEVTSNADLVEIAKKLSFFDDSQPPSNNSDTDLQRKIDN